MPIPSDTVLHRRAEISVHESPDGVVIMNLRSGDCFQLNQVGRQVWNRLNGTRDVTAICDEIGTLYGIDPAKVATDVSELLDALLRAGLVQRR